MSEKNKKQKITFKPSGLSYMADTGMTIFEIANKLDIAIRSECGGKGFCGKCKVLAEPDSNLSPVSEAELNLIGSEEIAKGFRLACQKQI
ncbi:MAG: 2Fe-2S iron-sulfur cluster binding domain-containing protein [Deltaproteobacteria bacterium]|nr:2Fe-2S iron-sulfur cluster binding domain-containing protein [Deltaproteobacteria bacterium]